MAVPILYIFNDVSRISMRTYKVDDARERVTYLRSESEALAYIDSCISRARVQGVIPILCAYNLAFDLQTIMEGLHGKYGMRVNAQSSTNIYTLDLYEGDNQVMRIWDTYHLEMRGLKAMGETCGVAKLMGEWDYDLIRTPETELTAQELEYAKRDVQVIPAYLRYLCDANEWLDPGMLGVEVLTKTSLVRQMAKREIGPRQVGTRKGPATLLRSFTITCRAERAQDFESYALRLACFRGGLTFTAGATASEVVQHVLSLDETSAHHAFINGRRVPVGFKPLSLDTMRLWLWDIGRYSLKDVLHRYAYPFQRWFHMGIKLTNVRMREGSAFATWGIGLLAQAKFGRKVARRDVGDENLRAVDAVEGVRASGFVDSCEGATFAFSKLVSADSVIVHVSELEYWCMLQVYEWDDAEPVYGEGTINSIWPPDYVTMQSNLLFDRKTDAKRINASYEEGVPYDLDIPASIPQGIAQGLREGAFTDSFVAAWYGNAVKGQFNGIYGVQAQNTFKPDYEVRADAELGIDASTRPTPENFPDKLRAQKRPMVLYPYGLRIVGGSRMQLVIAIMLLYDALGDRVTVTGGDTDSLKVRCDLDVTPSDVLAALGPLHDATTDAIDLCMGRLRATCPDVASSLDNVGCFEVEPATREDAFYTWHMEGWPKARVSIDASGRPHVTCAGLSRPAGAYTIEDWIGARLADGADPRELLPDVLGYNVTITNEVCHALEHHKPAYLDTVSVDITDYKGKVAHVTCHEAVALYDTSRKLGDTIKRVNAANVTYLAAHGRDVDTTERIITVDYLLMMALAMRGRAWCLTICAYLLTHYVRPVLLRQTMEGMQEVSA